MKNLGSILWGMFKYLILGICRSLMFLFIIILFFYFVVFFKNRQNLYEQKKVERGILSIELDGQLSDLSELNIFEIQFAQSNPYVPTSFIHLLNGIYNAVSDPSIRAIYIKISNFNIGLAQTDELIKALLEFRSSGKKIYIYSEYFDCKSYAFAATVASEIYCPPLGTFVLKGLCIVSTYYRNFLSKLEIVPVILRCGKYKSAIEPFSSTCMSEEDKEQNLALLDNIYSGYLNAYAYFSGLNSKKINFLIGNLTVYDVSKALEYNFITDKIHEIDVLNKLSKIGSSIGIQPYVKCIPKRNKKDKIVVLTLEGEIGMGNSQSRKIGCKTFEKRIDEIKKKQSVKALVLRVNSPGGNALASDIIWRAIVDFKCQKPVVCSFSDYAASGGYYIATACNRIFANPHTITGSIGVFGLFFDFHKILNDKIGINTDVLKTSPYADLGLNQGRHISDYEKNILQQQVEEVYNVFILRVMEGRNLSNAAVLKLASGRVWSGLKACEYNLIDKIGGLNDAINSVATLAKISDYSIEYQTLNGYYSTLNSFLKGIQSFVNFLKLDKFALKENLSNFNSSLYQGVYLRTEYDFEIK